MYIIGSNRNRIYETGIQLKSDWIMTFYILRHQIAQYPTVKDNADLELLLTPRCKVRNSSYEFAVISKNKILRDFWETQSLKNGLNRRFWKKIASLWLRMLRIRRIFITSRAINKVIGTHSKKLSTSYIVYDVILLYKMFSIVYFWIFKPHFS